MKKYAISYISFFENDLKMEIIEAENNVKALKIAFEILHGEDSNDFDENTDAGDIIDLSFDCDSLVQCIEI